VGERASLLAENSQYFEQKGATTLSITAFSIMTLSIMTFSIKGLFAKLSIMTFNIMALSITINKMRHSSQ
jgi:hypothetical protein